MGKMFLDIIQGKTGETCPLEDAILSDTLRSHERYGHPKQKKRHLGSAKRRSGW